MGTTLGLPRPLSIIGYSGRTTEKVSNLLGVSRRNNVKYAGESAGIDPSAQERFLEARLTRRQKALDAILNSRTLPETERDRALSLIPRIGTIAVVSAANYMHSKKDVRRWVDGALEGLDRTGVHRGMSSVALQTVVHTEGVYDHCFARYADELSSTGTKRGFIMERPLDPIVLEVDHDKSGQLTYLPAWLSSALENIDCPPNRQNPLDQGVVLLTDELSFTHAVRSNVRSSEFADVFNLEVSQAVGVLSMHDMYENGAVRFSRGSYPH